MIQKKTTTVLQRFPNDYFAAGVGTCDVIKRALFAHYVGNIIYHKFSYGDVSCRLNGENVNAMLEYVITKR